MIDQVHVYLCSLDMGVSKLLGNGIDIDSIGNHKGSICMTEAMEGDVLVDMCFL